MMESDVLVILPSLGAQNILEFSHTPEDRIALNERKRIEE